MSNFQQSPLLPQVVVSVEFLDAALGSESHFSEDDSAGDFVEIETAEVEACGAVFGHPDHFIEAFWLGKSPSFLVSGVLDVVCQVPVKVIVIEIHLAVRIVGIAAIGHEARIHLAFEAVELVVDNRLLA